MLQIDTKPEKFTICSEGINQSFLGESSSMEIMRDREQFSLFGSHVTEDWPQKTALPASELILMESVLFVV